VLRQVADEKNATSNQIVLAWMLHGDPFVLPLIASSTSEQMDENIQALEIRLSAEEMARLDSAGV
jgi:aryl-alcohol dehydrogenase-like predicted oxidoreductase